ncbi:MAG: hypothetical protein LBP91_00655 [Coriobacteriales bacterium]|jgi:hypothetical protein|nr:hypothetical protein [Coriobacteriales bacterium]
MKNRLLSILLAVTLLGTMLLAGCGGASDKPADGAAQVQQSGLEAVEKYTFTMDEESFSLTLQDNWYVDEEFVNGAYLRQKIEAFDIPEMWLNFYKLSSGSSIESYMEDRFGDDQGLERVNDVTINGVDYAMYVITDTKTIYLFTTPGKLDTKGNYFIEIYIRWLSLEEITPLLKTLDIEWSA